MARYHLRLRCLRQLQSHRHAAHRDHQHLYLEEDTGSWLCEHGSIRGMLLVLSPHTEKESALLSDYEKQVTVAKLDYHNQLTGFLCRIRGIPSVTTMGIQQHEDSPTKKGCCR